MLTVRDSSPFLARYQVCLVSTEFASRMRLDGVLEEGIEKLSATWDPECSPLSLPLFDDIGHVQLRHCEPTSDESEPLGLFQPGIGCDGY